MHPDRNNPSPPKAPANYHLLRDHMFKLRPANPNDPNSPPLNYDGTPIERLDMTSIPQLLLKGGGTFDEKEMLAAWRYYRHRQIDAQHQYEMSPRDQQMLEMLRDGMSQRDVGTELGISVARVSQIVAKMRDAGIDVPNNRQLLVGKKIAKKVSERLTAVDPELAKQHIQNRMEEALARTKLLEQRTQAELEATRLRYEARLREVERRREAQLLRETLLLKRLKAEEENRVLQTEKLKLRQTQLEHERAMREARKQRLEAEALERRQRADSRYEMEQLQRMNDEGAARTRREVARQKELAAEALTDEQKYEQEREREARAGEHLRISRELWPGTEDVE